MWADNSWKSKHNHFMKMKKNGEKNHTRLFVWCRSCPNVKYYFNDAVWLPLHVACFNEARTEKIYLKC